MKNTLLTLLSVLFCAIIFAQSVPQGINYQAVARDANGDLLMNQALIIQFSVISDITTSAIRWQETQSLTTNDDGLFTAIIGQGTATNGGFSATFDVIDWGASNHLLKVEIDYGSGLVDMGTTAFMSIPYALYSATSSVVTYSVGDFAHGGVVFWVDQTGQHGLVCAKIDQSSNIRWYAGTYGDTQSKGDGIYAGRTNTAIIITSQVALGDDGAPYAARICNELQIIEGGITYGDWYLPSKFELNEMYLEKNTIDATAIANGGISFAVMATDYYWSSTEGASNLAWKNWFGNGGTLSDTKYWANHVRAIRAF